MVGRLLCPLVQLPRVKLQRSYYGASEPAGGHPRALLQATPALPTQVPRRYTHAAVAQDR